MRFSLLLVGLSCVGIGVAACSSSGPASSDGHDGGVDGSSDASMMDQIASCSGIAACYSAAVTVSPTAPATCGTGTFTQLADYSTLPAGGGPFTFDGCTGQLSGCEMSFTCQNGEAWTVAFSGSGFTAQISQMQAGGKCAATAIGTRLAACPAAGDDGGVDAYAEASSAADVAVESSTTADGGGADSTAGGVDSGVEGSTLDASVDAGEASTGDAGSGLDALADATAEGGADANLEAGDDGGDASEASLDGPTE